MAIDVLGEELQQHVLPHAQFVPESSLWQMMNS